MFGIIIDPDINAVALRKQVILDRPMLGLGWVDGDIECQRDKDQSGDSHGERFVCSNFIMLRERGMLAGAGTVRSMVP
jgi:hypothetical protein